MRLEHQFQALLAGAPDALIIADVAGHILIANSQAEQLFGYAASELIGQPVELLLPLALHTRHVQHRADYSADPHTRPMGSELALVAQRKDGSSFPVEISLSAIQTAAGLLITSAIRDVTERKQAEDSVRNMATRKAQELQAKAETEAKTRLKDEAAKRLKDSTTRKAADAVKNQAKDKLKGLFGK